MNVQIENIVPDGFAYERAQNVMHGKYGGTELLIIPMMAEDQFQIQLYSDLENSGGKDSFLKSLQALHIAGIAGYAIVFCGMKGYELLGKKLSKAGIVICVILSFLMIAGAEFVSLAITIYSEMGSLFVSSVWDAFGWIPELMQEPELAAGVAKDLAFGYILAIWASYAFVKSVWKQVEEKQKPHVVERF